MRSRPSQPTVSSVPIPANEVDRLAALRRYSILDTPPEAAFDRITSLAARLFEMPIALVSLVDETRAWFKSSHGFDLPEVPRDATLCSFALLYDDVLVIPDTRADERFACNPFVQREPGVRFYAGAPLMTPDGFNLGTLCLLDSQPREALSVQQQAILADLAAIVVDELELRFAAYQLSQQEAEQKRILQREQAAWKEASLAWQALEQEAARLINILEGTTDCFVALDREWRVVQVNQATARLNNLSPEDLIGKTHWEIWPWSVGTVIEQRYREAIVSGVPAEFEVLYEPAGLWLEIHAYPSVDGLNIFFRDITDRKKTELILSENEERLRLTLASANQGWYDLNVQTGAAIVSPEYAQMLGYNPATFEETNAKWRERLHPDDWEPISQTYEDYICGKRSDYRIEFRQRTQTGAWKWILSLGKIVEWDENGEPLRMLGTHTDISDLKAAEAALQQSEARFRQLADALPQIVWISDATGAPEYVSQRWTDYTGLSLEQTHEQNFIATVIHPDDMAPTYAIWESCLATGTLYQTEFRLKRAADQRYRWMLCRAVPIHDESGQIVHWYGTLTDIDDRKRIEDELQQTNQTLSTLIAASPLPIVVIDPDATVRIWNPAAEQLFGWRKAEVLNQPIPVVPSEKLEECRELRSRVANGETFFGVETYRCNQTGSHVVVSVSAAPLYGEHDHVEQIMLIIQDITERKRVEDERKQAEAEREQLLIREQTAREQAEKANRIKDEFLAVLSHELRTPLNPILGWIKLLQAGKLNASQMQQALSTIERNARLQTQLIDDLLDVSRILRGKLVLNSDSVTLTTVIEAAIETVRLAAEAKSIQIQTSLDSTVGAVLGDAGRLQQVVWNLLTNAVKFTPSEGRVEVRLTHTRYQAQIQVIDTGKGISPGFLPHVFERFQQADSSTTRQFGGLGLGLAIVRQLVELHGGTVEAYSAGEGQGAAFTVRLPLSQASTGTIVLPDHDPLHATSLVGLRVLVVDDEADARGLVQFILEQEGAIVTNAASGIDALRVLRQSEFDVLISDIAMPDLDGYMLLEQVRAEHVKQSIPAIALTAYAGEFNQQKAITAGFKCHLSKPLDPEALVTAITGLMSVS